MVPEYEYGKFAGWIAPPQTGINDQPVEFDYVHLAEEGAGCDAESAVDRTT